MRPFLLLFVLLLAVCLPGQCILPIGGLETPATPGAMAIWPAGAPGLVFLPAIGALPSNPQGVPAGFTHQVGEAAGYGAQNANAVDISLASEPPYIHNILSLQLNVDELHLRVNNGMAPQYGVDSGCTYAILFAVPAIQSLWEVAPSVFGPYIASVSTGAFSAPVAQIAIQPVSLYPWGFAPTWTPSLPASHPLSLAGRPTLAQLRLAGDNIAGITPGLAMGFQVAYFVPDGTGLHFVYVAKPVVKVFP